MRIISADALYDAMYHEAFENDASYNEKNPMAKWDSGLWIRYKMFENCLDNAPTIETKQIKYFDEDEKVWKVGEVIVIDRKDEPKDEPQTYVINPQEPTNNDKCFECDDFFTCGGQCNKIEDELQTEIPEYAEWKEPFQKMMEVCK